MINFEISAAVTSVVDNLVSQNLEVFVKPDSPVALLSSCMNVAFKESAKGDISQMVTPLNNLIFSADEATEKVFDSVAQEIADKLSNHLNFARNTVAPMVGEFAEAIIPAVTIATKSRMEYLEIVQENIPTLALNPALNVSGFDISTSIGMPRLEHDAPRSDEQVLELMLTGKASLDADIQVFYASLPNGALSTIWDGFFSNRIGRGNEQGLSSIELMANTVYGLTRSLVVYLVASKLSVRAESDCNAPESVYTERALQLRNQAGTFIRRYVTTYEQQIDDGVVILAEVYPKIYVNGGVYRKYLLEGGSTDVILGRSLCKGTECTVKGLTEKKERYESAWRSFETQSLLEADNIRHLETVRILRNSFPEFISKLSEDIAPTHTRMRIVELFESKLGTLQPESTQNVYAASLTLLCHALFNHTDAYAILSGVAAASKINPKATPAECASVSVQEYLGSWIASCLAVVKKSH